MSPAAVPPEASGQCLCGAVRFTAPLPPLWVAHCHCTRCQRAHGAAFVTWVGVDEVVATIADAQAQLRWFTQPQGSRRGFCGQCGSPMFFQAPAWPGELHIARALFNEALAQTPQVHACDDTRVDWVHLADDLPRQSDPNA